MDPGYPYNNSQNRTSFDMIRTLQSNTDYNYDEQRRRSSMAAGNHYRPSAPNGYSLNGSQLPPLNVQGGSGASYGGMQQPRSQHTSPVSHSMPFPMSQYGSQAPYSGNVPTYPNTSTFQQNPSYAFPGAIPYQGNSYHSPSTGVNDYPNLATTSHAQTMPNTSVTQYPTQYPFNREPEYPRTHVVGAQGRRGILPSDEGRPSALGRQTSARNQAAPQRDENGKYPCQHCNKTYLHSKHLKRHMLRHTGDRPYTCVLCSDTFSRSDILKRHFQKCSIRRGNPTGATHLSDPSAYNKRNNTNRKGSNSLATTDARPTTSDSESANSTSQSAADGSFDHAAEMAVGAGEATQNHHPSAINGVMMYGRDALHASPAQSPTTTRPPMGFYGNGAFAPNGSGGFPGHPGAGYPPNGYTS